MGKCRKPCLSYSDSEDKEDELSVSEDDVSQAPDSDSRDNQKQEKKKPLIPPPQSSNQPHCTCLTSSDSEESCPETGSDSDSDSDSDSKPPPEKLINANIKHVSSKLQGRESNQESKSTKKSRPKASSAPPPPKTKRPSSPPSTASEKVAKKAKRSTAADEDLKKQVFHRLWSDDDEILMLKGMIDYKSEKNGKDPVADMGAFHEFIKKALHVDYSRAQLVGKVRRLRRKYEGNVWREKGKHRNISSTKSHEQKVYNLSKLIWGGTSNNDNIGTESKMNQNQENGDANGNASRLKANRVAEKEASKVGNENKKDIPPFIQFGSSNNSPILREEIMKAGLELVEGSKRAELEGKWKKLKTQELQLFVQLMDLLKLQAAVVLKTVNSSGN